MPTRAGGRILWKGTNVQSAELRRKAIKQRQGDQLVLESPRPTGGAFQSQADTSPSRICNDSWARLFLSTKDMLAPGWSNALKPSQHMKLHAPLRSFSFLFLLN